MQPLSSPQPQNLYVNAEHDIISLRQAVRQMARGVGLGLPEQARITAAISEVARAFLLNGGTARFIIQVTDHNPHPALEVVCVLPFAAHANQTSYSLSEACALVDEANLAVFNDGMPLILRMWLNHGSQKK